MKKIIFVFLLFFLLINESLECRTTEPPVQFSDARVMGMGNAFVAVADDKNMLFFNPAGFADYGLIKTSKLDAIRNPTLWKPRYTNLGELTIFSFTFGFDTDILSKFGLSNMLNSLGLGDEDTSAPLYMIIKNDYFTKISEGTLTRTEAEELNGYLTQLYYLRLHPRFNFEYFSIARHYFGFGYFYSSDTVFQIKPSALTFFNFNISSYNDFILPIGIGMHIPEHREWSIGLTLKYFHRVKVEVNGLADILTLKEFFEGDYIYEDLMDRIKQKSLFSLLTSGVDYTSTGIDQFKIGTGYGFDIGVLYRPEYSWKFGALISDVYTKINWWDGTASSRIPINLRLGVAYMPGISLAGIFENPILSADIEDIFHQQGKNFFLKLHFGTEFKFLFRLLTVRAGINEGYPSVGVGIDLSFYFLSKIPLLKYLRPDSVYFPKFNPDDKEFLAKNPVCCCFTGLLAPILYAHIKIDASYTGFELGAKPGQIPSYQFLFRISWSYSY